VIRLVTFDFWHTLLFDTADGMTQAHATRLRGVGEMLAGAGHPVAPEALAAADRRALADFETVWSAQRDMTSSEQIDRFLAAIDPALPGVLSVAVRAAVAEAYAAPALAHPPQTSPGAVETVEALHARGLALALISNTGRTPGRVLRQLLARAGILDCFAALSFSDEVGVRKPAPAIFRATLARTGHSPGEAVHVGDDAAADVAGARGAGMRAVHYVARGGSPAPEADGAARHLAELPDVIARLG
jgi:putative hydrolase of the HAD superfamily